MIKSQFSYCLLVWMFCSKQSNSLLKKVQGRALILISNEQQSGCQLMVDKYNEYSGHQRNVQNYQSNCSTNNELTFYA